MLVEFSQGKIIVTTHEVVVKLAAPSQCMLHAQSEAISLFSGANVMVANTGAVKWTITLDNPQQLNILSEQLGCDIQ
ncbi:DUF3389 family protein [Vibrio sp. CAIM 722]|uniref:DUF3389 family protein n=1 Tax=Vibrio eleionomae TaxID=2653505 RepID=A0A7X4LL20_9VIBR|nr:DUF3389 family protein [Vibrio eleionomae]MZI93933.1 DUF3389 family protein [Vibrio eleionomae]